MRSVKKDSLFVILFGVLVFVGFMIFTSASLGLLARDGAAFSSVAIKQLLIGVVLGSIFLFVFSRIHYTFWKKHAFVILIISAVSAILVFLPKIGFAHGGAKRWIALGPLTFQPSEFLKIGMVVYCAAWFSVAKEKIAGFTFGLLPFCIMVGISAVLLLLEPDTGTFLVLFATLLAMYLVAGGKWRDILILFSGCILAGALLFTVRPYFKDRILTFMDPSRDPQGAGYQIQQSLIAIGSGRITGRGFGKSIQKFNYLPEPIGDSIFAVASEEFGFIGASTLILLYVAIGIAGLRLAAATKDPFGRLLATGIVILILSGSFLNIASMLGVLPLTGVPLIFVSQGGTALLLSFAEVGILLNISKNRK